ncbi:MAG: S41 family peptidase [Alphaproteobacteria bacterium]|nr:S41 family peptidase [Alphaproteobacteria bacterium]
MIRNSAPCRLLGPAFAGVLALGLAACSHTPGVPRDDASAAPAAVATPSHDTDMKLYTRVLDRVRASYVEPVSEDKLVANSLKGMLSALDPHSDYLDESEYQDLLDESEGEFAGIGAEITRDESHPKVISPIDNTPAARAGLKPGDIILKIDGKLTEGMDLKGVVDRLRGPVGTPVHVTIVRTGTRPFEVTINRAVIHVASVKSRLEPDKIGYIRISLFSEKTNDELVKAIDTLTQQARGRLNGLVLDLRNDPGGLLDQAVAVAGDFLDGGVVVSTRGRDPDDNRVFTAPGGGDRVAGVPMVVLINGASASASEIVAGALKERHRAQILGTRSFGKGSVQTIIPLDGRGAIRLTTALYYTPSGNSIQDRGITPDLVVLPPKNRREPLVDVVHEADLKGALSNPGGAIKAAANENSPEANIDPMLIGTPKDSQLTTAVDRLETELRKTAATAAR